MRKVLYTLLLATLCLPSLTVRAQEKPKSEERPRAGVPIKVQIVFTEFDGDKKISSLPYTFTVLANDRGVDGTNVRTGVRIPIETDSKDQKMTYMDVGSNIDCRIRIEDEGRFAVSLSLDRSALYPNKSTEGERLVSEPNGMPLIHQFRAYQNLLLKDGQTSENFLSTDPMNGHTIRVSVTINATK